MRRSPPATSLGPWLPRRPQVAGYLDLQCGTLENHGWVRRSLVIRGDWGDPVEELDLSISLAHPSYMEGEPELFMERAERHRMARFVYEIEGERTSLWVFRSFARPNVARFIAVWREHVAEDYDGSARVVTDGWDHYVWRSLDYIAEWPRLRSLFVALFHLGRE